MKMKIILKDMDPDDFILGVRAAKYLLARFRQDAIVSYGEGKEMKNFYAKRNKQSITDYNLSDLLTHHETSSCT